MFSLGGVEGVQLRLDDHGLSTGQIVKVVADAAAGATTLSIMALAQPLLKGTVLEFDGGGMASNVEVTLSAVAQVGTNSLTVNALSVQVNANAQATDNGVNLATAQRLLMGCQYATARIKLYCCGRYDDSQLVLANSVNFWARYLACKWVCSRRGQSPPKSVVDECELIMKELEKVQCKQLNIEDIGTRTADWPFITNTTVDPIFTIAKTRVEPQISEGTPTVYPQMIDWTSVYALIY